MWLQCINTKIATFYYFKDNFLNDDDLVIQKYMLHRSFEMKDCLFLILTSGS